MIALMHLRSHWRFIGVLFIISLVVRLAFFMCYTRHGEHAYLAFDSAQYTKVARHIAAGDGIAQEKGVPNFYRLPGYPLFLAASYKMFGDDDYKALLLQLFIVSVIPFLIFILSLVLFPGYVRCAQCAGLISVGHVGLVYYSGIVATESLFLLFLLLFFISFLPFIKQRGEGMSVFHRLTALFFAGTMLGCASLFRAVGHYLIVLSIILLVLSAGTMSDKLWRSLSLFCGWISVVGWWLARNYLLTGFLFFHSLPGLHFLQYAAVHADMGYVNFGDDAYFATKKKLLDQWAASVSLQESTQKRTLGEYERYMVAEQLAYSYLIRSPLTTMKNSMVNVIRTMGTLYSSLLLYVAPGTVYERGTSLWFKIKLYLTPRVQEPWIRYVVYWDMVLFFLLLAGCLAFLWSALFSAAAWDCLLMIAPFITLFAAITLAYGCARLRLPIEPLMIVVATWGLFSSRR